MLFGVLFGYLEQVDVLAASTGYQHDTDAKVRIEASLCHHLRSVPHCLLYYFEAVP